MRRLVYTLLYIFICTYAFAQSQFNFNKWQEEQQKPRNDGKENIDEDLLKSNTIYGNAFLQAGHLHGPGISIGGFIDDINIEVGYVHGLSESYQITRHYSTGEQHAYTYQPKAFDAKVGYGFRTLGCLRITPQVGTTIVKVNGRQANETYVRNKENAQVIDIVGSLRIDYSFTRNFGLSIVPQYSKKVSGDSLYDSITKEEYTKDIVNWTEGLTCRLGLYINL